jgi:ABC-type antimicrobial peptide transport system permease subunit
MSALTMAGFFGIFVLCVAGLFSHRFQDNWFQHLGMIGVGISSVSALHRVFHMEWVPPEMTLFALAALGYGLGTAYKVWHHRHSYQRKPHAHKPVPSKVG